MKNQELQNFGDELSAACPCQISVEIEEGTSISMQLKDVQFRYRKVDGAQTRTFSAILMTDSDVPFIQGLCNMQLSNGIKAESLWVSRILSSQPDKSAYELLVS